MTPSKQHVYVVEEGEYSDYHIEAIFATRKEAEQYLIVVPTDNGRIVEWEIGHPAAGRGLHLFKVFIRTAPDNYTQVIYLGPVEADSPKMTSSAHRNLYRDDSQEYVWVENIRARDQHHAAKIATDERAKVLALGVFEIHDYRSGG